MKIIKQSILSLAVVLTMLMANSYGNLTTEIEAAQSTWDGTATDTSFYNSNSSASEFVISTPEQLAGFRDLVNGGQKFSGKTIKLSANIDLGNMEWVPIGDNSSTSLQGAIFDGQGFSVKNFKITGAMWFKGFFGIVQSTTIQNLGLENGIIEASNGGDVGMLVGQGNDSIIYRCHTSGEIDVTAGIGDAVGGLVGIAYSEDGTKGGIQESYSSVSIHATTPEGGQYGGLVGWVSVYNESEYLISNCFFDGSVVVDDGESATGGLVGIAISITGDFGFPDLPQGKIVLQNCYVSGEVVNNADSVVALGIGLVDAIVENCYWLDSLGVDGVVQMKWELGIGLVTGADSNTTNTSSKSLDAMKTNIFLDVMNGAQVPSPWAMVRNNPDVLLPILSFTLGNYPADYSLVSEAISNIPVVLTNFTDDSIAGLQALQNSVQYGLSAQQQNEVDGFASAIENAINALVYKGADYSGVETAIAGIPADLSQYTQESVATLLRAKNAVILNKSILDQTLVDGYKQDILDAIDGLILSETTKPIPPTLQPTEDKKVEENLPATGDATNFYAFVGLGIATIGIIMISINKKIKTKV